VERLVYSPKVYAFLKTDGTRAVGPDTYLDVSDFIVGGNVQRVINAASTASLELRNPDRIWTQPSQALLSSFNASNINGKSIVNLGLQPANTPVFHPMDEITIYMSRFTNKPIQVFTGYLDSSTYLQLYPGTITLTATCTLKRLLYTYWDPALPNITSLLVKAGWEANLQAGTLNNINAGAGQTLTKSKGTLNDGSITALIYALMTEICNWDDSEILIENIPTNIIDFVKNVYKTIQQDNALEESEYNSFLKSVIGAGGMGSSTGGTGSGPAGSGNLAGAKGLTMGGTPLTQAQLTAANTLLAEGSALGAPTAAMEAIIYAGMGESGLTTGRAGGGILQGTTFPNPNDDTAEAKAFFLGGNGYNNGGAIHLANIGTPVWKIANMVEDNGAWLGAANGGQGPGGVDSYAQNGTFPGGQNQGLAEAAAVVNAYLAGGGSGGTNKVNAGASNNSSAANVNSTVAKKNGGGGTTGSSAGPTKGGQMTALAALNGAANAIAAQNYPYTWSGGHPQVGVPSVGQPGGPSTGTGVGYDCSGAVAAVLHAAGYAVASSVPASSGVMGPVVAAGQATQVSVAQALANTSGVSVFANADHIWMQIQGKTWQSTSAQNQAGATNALGGPGWTGPLSNFASFAQGFTAYNLNNLNKTVTYNLSLAPGDTGSTGAPGTGTVSSGNNAEAFAVSLTYPSVQEEFQALVVAGQKSLMNDVSIFPFIQQIVQAGLRSFQSLPNGTFFAFYPDYFGEFSGGYEGSTGPSSPYWEINDLEIQSGSIVLSDDALATHVYVIGDTVSLPWGGNQNELANIIGSGGVATIFDAFESGFVDFSGSDSPDAQYKGKIDAIQFLSRYGARPYINQDASFVRNSYLEAFMAFQTFMLMWARQFQTQFDFTFMPELYPGGRVGFPDHGFQCYIDSVTHTFSYTEGFTTSAQLEAPSVLPGYANTGFSQGMVRGGMLKPPVPSAKTNKANAASNKNTHVKGKKIRR
jgi:hypothetical protein